ncbi:chitin elicitor receptor kinase 1-like isoform X3 [Rhododendron vialii]|uniref:chitin elicitor receptor kinase 1-like isoform X3 n=1 Tax=Rhododendron vialii TaxID=182163 RepID=UPI00265E82B8|nr:chitin elicitor receptor kinase 1-like isoform X3 [Rhododendron vialii]
MGMVQAPLAVLLQALPAQQWTNLWNSLMKNLRRQLMTSILLIRLAKGGFGAVYYAELRGEKAAIKKMAMQASREFLAELKVLTHVHHLNLVHLIGCCVEGSLFLVYEYIENGNLSTWIRQ